MKTWHWLLILILISNYVVSSAQEVKDQKKDRFERFVKLNTEYREYASNRWFGNWMPGYLLTTKRVIHEISHSHLTYSKQPELDAYNIRSFSTGLMYHFKRSIFRNSGALIPFVGLSVQGDYYSSHAVPFTPDVHKEFYLKTFTCMLAANASLSYQINERFILDLDFPFPVWRVMFFRQRDILPITRDRRILSGQDFYSPPEYFFNFRLSARYNIR